MKLTFEIIAGLAGFAGWILFFIQRIRLENCRRQLKREEQEATDLFHLKNVLMQENAELSENAAGWRAAAWVGLFFLSLIAALEAWKKWKARK